MSLTRFLKDVGRPVAYYPKLALMLESVNAAVFLCQLLYWSDKGNDAEGWIYKTQTEMEEETGLTRRKQESVRKKLSEMGVLEETRRGSHGTLHFRVNTKRLDELWSEWLKPPMDKNANGESAQTPMAETASLYTETTPETTNEDIAPAPAFLPPWLSPKVWARWVTHRREIKHPITMQQAEAQFRLLDKFRARGMPPEEVIERSISNGWQGLFELKPERADNGKTNQQPRAAYGKPPVTRDYSKFRPPAGRN